VLGQFDVDWLRQTGIDTIGKRSTKALLNPNKQENWDTINEQTNLRMLARSFRFFNFFIPKMEKKTLEKNSTAEDLA